MVAGGTNTRSIYLLGLAFSWWYALITMVLRTGCFARVREQGHDLLEFHFISLASVPLKKVCLSWCRSQRTPTH